jgi:hypothetical protein
MKPTLKRHNFKFALLLVLLAYRASAQTQPTSSLDVPTTLSLDDNFRTGWHEAQIGSGVYFSNIFRNYNRPKVDYVVGFAQAAGQLHRRRDALVPV